MPTIAEGASGMRSPAAEVALDPVAMGLSLARAECEARLEAGHPMRAVEEYVGSLPVDDDARRSLWKWAWAYGERTPPR